MLMKVSHGSPISILQESQKYNDFDYALVHLFEEFPCLGCSKELVHSVVSWIEWIL